MEIVQPTQFTWAHLAWLVWGVVTLIASVLFTWLIVRTCGRTVLNMLARVQTVPAQVIDKREAPARLAFATGAWHCYLAFESDDGQHIEFVLPRGEWSEFEIGDRGYLTFQGTLYRGFRCIAGPQADD